MAQLKRHMRGDMTGISFDTILGSSHVSRTKILCNHCGRGECRLERAARSRFTRTKDKSNACSEFIPVLRFRDLTGLDLFSFNTFRGGIAWCDRVKIGSIVALQDSATKKILSYAVVQRLTTADRELAEQLYGADNHLMAGQKFDLERFRKLRRRNSRYSESSVVVTVLWLQRVPQRVPE